jgi:cellobiose transport system permease protein
MAVTSKTAPVVTTATVSTADKPPSKFRQAFPQYAAVSPFFILFAIFGAFPVLFSIWISFHSWDGIGQMKWVGLEQYNYLLSDPVFWKTIGNTMIIWVLSTVPMLLLALMIANALHNATRLRTFYRIAYFIPNVTSVVAITLVFGSIFSNNFGLLNAFLRSIGVGEVQWLTSPWGIKIAIATIVTWRWVGYNAIIYLAGLQAISADVYEAAKVDGASPRQTFWRITVPMMRPVILFTAVTSTIGGLQIFTEPRLFDDTPNREGGADHQFMTTTLYIYVRGIEDQFYGRASAAAWLLFLIIVGIALLNFAITRYVTRRQS